MFVAHLIPQERGLIADGTVLVRLCLAAENEVLRARQINILIIGLKSCMYRHTLDHYVDFEAARRPVSAGGPRQMARAQQCSGIPVCRRCSQQLEPNPAAASPPQGL